MCALANQSPFWIRNLQAINITRDGNALGCLVALCELISVFDRCAHGQETVLVQ